ncbi:MAG TPA: 4a-hydroxytetrahydrobiopterin dehydratase [Verrucomicrobiae bacterium]|nr:4a-hydroxytetrahydrobiopterin dehydratase [Verrucomicrobiae bacterium]
MAKLTAVEIKEALHGVPQWSKKGKTIVRNFEFKDFAGSMRFVNAVAKVAEKMEHHPDIEIHWNQVVLSLTTHDQGGLTTSDFALAQKIDPLATRN